MERVKRILLITIILILLMILQTTISEAAEISSRQFEIDEEAKTISKIPMGTTAEKVKTYIASEEEIKMFSKEGSEVENSHEITTGMILKAGEEEYSLVITGDTSGDGKRTVVDIAQVKMHLVRLKLIILGLLDIDSNLKVPIPVPEGYVASEVEGENKIEDGYVIYEGTEPVTDENHETALTTRNQYVWIPVGDINDMVMCESNTGDSICDLKYDEVADTLTCQTHPETATNLVGRLYSSYSYTMDFTKRDQTYDENDHHEPNTVSYDAYHSLTIDQLKSDFTAMAKSVAKNGGFYISRYEVGEGGSSKKGQPVLTGAATGGGSGETEYLGANKWYGLYNSIRKIDENKQMIWGCQYDQVIKFIGEQAQVGHSDRNLTTDHALSGQNELDCMNNIYDLEGNHNEWTAEASSSNYRAFRGSYYNLASLGYFDPASDRGLSGYPTLSFNYSSSRTTLYL